MYNNEWIWIVYIMGKNDNWECIMIDIWMKMIRYNICVYVFIFIIIKNKQYNIIKYYNKIELSNLMMIMI